MDELILHHFDISPFAEKARLIMGLKRLSWRSVQIPIIMPKPDLTALTGGYRKTPVLQIGAEIYCDTRRIARELERRFPEPTLFPDGNSGMAIALSWWSDTRFFEPGAGLAMGTNAQIPEAVLQDRKAFFNFMDFSRMADEIPHLYSQLTAHAELVEEQLGDGRHFLFGDAPGLADLNAYFVIWMSRNNVAPVREKFARYRNMAAWEERIQALGHGQRTELSSEEAIRIARNSRPEAGAGVDADDPMQLRADERVIVEPDDYGKDPVSGNLATLNRREITVLRMDPRAGAINVHFPRAGYRIRRA